MKNQINCPTIANCKLCVNNQCYLCYENYYLDGSRTSCIRCPFPKIANEIYCDYSDELRIIRNGTDLSTIIPYISSLITTTDKIIIRYLLIEQNQITLKYFKKEKTYIFDETNIQSLNLLDSPNKYAIYLSIKSVQKYNIFIDPQSNSSCASGEYSQSLSAAYIQCKTSCSFITTPFLNHCTKPIQGCIKYGINNQCIQCSTQFYQLIIGTSEVICLQMALFPEIYQFEVYEHGSGNCAITKQGICIVCNERYILSGNTCVLKQCDDIIQNCLTCDQLTGDCIDCNINYILSEGECIPYTGCLLLNHNDMCMICENDYYWQINVCLPSSNCLAPNFFYQNNCIINEISNCQQAMYFDRVETIKQNCQTCDSQYSLQNVLYYIGCVDNTKLIPNCLIYNTLFICISCENGYYFSPTYDTCFSTQFCLDQLCENCQTGFQSFENNCLAQNCLIFKDDATCQQCQNTYSLFNNYCIQYPNCQVVVNDECSQCDSNYLLFSGNCYLAIPQCIDQFQNDCYKCQNNYILQLNNCYVLIPFCQTYDQVTKQCIHCMFNYLLMNLQCFEKIDHCLAQNESLCLSCEQDYFNISQKCIYYLNLISNCISYDKKNCSQCNLNTEFFNDQKQCVYLDSNCLKYDSQGYCINCKNSYYLENGICSEECLKIENCLQCDETDSHFCKKCKTGYYLINNECQYCNDYFSCSQKIEKQIELQDKCLWTVLNCVKCDSNLTWLCEECNQGFQLVEDYCEPYQCLFPCITCNQDNYCFNCFTGFILHDGQCFIEKLIQISKEQVLFNGIKFCHENVVCYLNQSYQNKFCSQCQEKCLCELKMIS